MAIKAYVGIMGSGKTFEVASHVILGALRDGRRVVSNIAGLDFDAFEVLLTAEGVAPEKIGSLVSVSHDQITEDLFFRTDKDIENGIASFIQPGDLVAIDEIWRFWDGFSKPPERFMNFVRMHRQFVHPDSGLTCELALITQDVMDIGRKVRAVIEQTYRMEKATALGSSKRYRVDIFQGGKTRGKPLRQLFKTYDPKFFGLYKSHSQAQEGSADAIEKSVDGRGNILKGALFKVVLPFFVLVFAGASYLLWGFFHPVGQKPVKSEKGASSSAERAETKSAAPRKSGPDVSESWRVYGWYSVGAQTVVILRNDGGRLRHVYSPPNVRLVGLDVGVLLDGEAFTPYSGGGGGRSPGMVEGAVR